MAVALNAGGRPHQACPSYAAQYPLKFEVERFDEADDDASVALLARSAKKMLAAQGMKRIDVLHVIHACLTYPATGFGLDI